MRWIKAKRKSCSKPLMQYLLKLWLKWLYDKGIDDGDISNGCGGNGLDIPISIWFKLFFPPFCVEINFLISSYKRLLPSLLSNISKNVDDFLRDGKLLLANTERKKKSIHNLGHRQWHWKLVFRYRNVCKFFSLFFIALIEYRGLYSNAAYSSLNKWNASIIIIDDIKTIL